MALWTPFRSWLEYSYDLLFRASAASVSPPNHANFYAILVNATINDTQAIATVVGNEVSGNGYARQNVTFSDTRAWDVTDSRIESAFSNTWTVTASGGNIAYQAAAIIADGTATQGNTTGRLVAYANFGAQTIDDGAGQEFKAYVAAK